jgi:uncharacterized protein YndB with AHSA1/START domain
VEAKNRINEFLITRVFDAGKEMLFKAWTEPDALKHWWGPKDFHWIGGQLNLYPGGVFHYCMQAPDGSDMWGRFVYLEIRKPNRLIFLNSFSDEEGNPVKHPLMPDWPLQILNTITFNEEGGKTTMVMRGTPLSATALECRTFEAGREQVCRGFALTWERLGAYLSVVNPGS